ncbi:MBL fold metallo-hydrolase [Leucobacter ruminantium]|uniref:MBL fold metallo-hydrolase n=1 Tax=Leucobacter ruminantium TaxID=1289170 RepID=A0A939M0C9_9MICO|nr:MBL fold metallo-hydrolase [Leucobacter ruminantium]MBO1806403.1 MBL fold metallo-hydrolase [Leucobacter ruminantium]
MDNVKVTLIGGPTLEIEVAGYRMLTDPTFDAPQVYHHPVAGPVIKTLGPSCTPEELGQIDLALASHEHIDNLDVSGRGFLTMVPLALTTTEAAAGFGDNVEGMDDYDVRRVELPDGRTMTITAVPAHHGPEGIWPVLGPVIGFVLQAESMPTIYISGDNSEVDIVSGIAERFPDIDIAVLFVGGAGFDVIADGACITLSNERALEAAKILGAKKVVPVHEDSWAHFRENVDEITKVFNEADLGELLVALRPGDSANIAF